MNLEEEQTASVPNDVIIIPEEEEEEEAASVPIDVMNPALGRRRRSRRHPTRSTSRTLH
jgi:hypothetical protein